MRIALDDMHTLYRHEHPQVIVWSDSTLKGYNYDLRDVIGRFILQL